jgi:hypothetical protein
MKKLITLLTLLAIASCASPAIKESIKNAKQNSTSTRINSSENNNKEMLKELDE